MTHWRWYALHDHDWEDSGLRDTIEGEIDAANEDEAISRVRAGECASGTPYPFGDMWAVWVEEMTEKEA
jgi:hypothetical protein